MNEKNHTQTRIKEGEEMHQKRKQRNEQAKATRKQAKASKQKATDM
jgi:hypothetical protein